MRMRSTSLRRPVALVLAGALVLAACSDDDDEPAATDAPAETEVTEAPSDTQAISTEPPPPAGEPFVFGFVQPAPGLLRDLSTAQLTSIQFAVDDINEAGGVNGGEASLIVAEEPAGGDPADAVRELVEGGANVILGPVGSTAALGILPALAETGTVACSASATLATLDQADTENRLFRTAISDAYTVGVLAQQIQTLRESEVGADAPYKVTIVARNDDYGVGVGNGLALTLTTAGITTEVISYNPRRVIFSGEAAQAASSGANLVLMVSYAESARLLTSLLDAGVAPTSIGGIEGAFDPRLAEAASPSDPSAADGVRVFGVTGDRAFIDRLVAAPGTTEILYGAQAYDCAVVAALAASVAGSGSADAYSAEMIGVTRDGRGCSTYADCVSSITAGDDIDYIGVTGGIAFDEFGSATEARFTVAQFTGGALEEVSSEEFDLSELQAIEFLQTAIFNTRLQQFLTVTGFYTGPINGLPSEEFTNSIIAFQASVGVPLTGVWDEATDTAAREKYGALYSLVGDSIAGLQQLLTDLGYYTGPIDGTYNPEFVAAVKALQADLGVPQTGIFDAATLTAIFNAGIATGTPPSTTAPPETTAPPTTAPPTTAPPTTAPPESTVPLPTLADLLSDPQFSTLSSLISCVGPSIDPPYQAPFTVLAPTNDAFEAAGVGPDFCVPDDPDTVQATISVLDLHVIEASRLTSLDGVTEVIPIRGTPLPVDTSVDPATIGGAPVAGPIVPASDGSVIPLTAVIAEP